MRSVSLQRTACAHRLIPWKMPYCRLPALLKAKGRAGWEAVRENLLLVLKQLDVEAQV